MYVSPQLKKSFFKVMVLVEAGMFHLLCISQISAENQRAQSYST